jgi:hypothetical protein
MISKGSVDKIIQVVNPRYIYLGCTKLRNEIETPTVASVRWKYKNPTQHVGLAQSGTHIISLKTYLFSQ